MMSRKRALSCVIAAFLILMTVFTGYASEWTIPMEGSMSGQTVIIHTNDSHGRGVADGGNKVMGFAAVSALKKRYEAAGANVLLLDAGDTLHGLPFATLSKGGSVVKLMNMAGYDAMTPGNHDFNYGSDYLAEISEQMDYPLISANAMIKDTGKTLLPANTIIEKNGIKYGIFGLTTPETSTKTKPDNVAGIRFDSPVEAAKRQVTELKAAGVDYIIALAHVGLLENSEYTTEMVAKQVEGIDVIIDGHSHTYLKDGLWAGDTLIASTGNYLQAVGVVTMKADGSKTAVLVTQEEFTEQDDSISQAAKEIQEEQDAMLAEVIGHTDVALDGEYMHVRREETNLGNLAADAIREETGADIAMINGGGIRATVQAGEITKKDLVSVFPFGNYVVTKKISGKVLKEFLEAGFDTYPEKKGGFPQLSGVTVSFDSSKPAGSRVQSVTVQGKALDENQTYLFAANDYIMSGGDSYTMLSDLPVEGEYGSLEEILINYIKNAGVVNIQVEGRIVEVNQNLEEDRDKNPYYTVQKGDSLYRIAKKQLGDGRLWTAIYSLNMDQIKNPDYIYPGQQLRLNEMMR